MLTSSVDRLGLGKGVQEEGTKEAEKANYRKRKVKSSSWERRREGGLWRRRRLPFCGNEMFLQGCQSYLLISLHNPPTQDVTVLKSRKKQEVTRPG